MDVNPQEGRDERYNELTRILKDLPKHHKETIEKIFYHLGSVARRSEENRMDPQSLAIVLAPCIIRYSIRPANPVFSRIFFHIIFSEPRQTYRC